MDGGPLGRPELEVGRRITPEKPRDLRAEEGDVGIIGLEGHRFPMNVCSLAPRATAAAAEREARRGEGERPALAQRHYTDTLLTELLTELLTGGLVMHYSVSYSRSAG